MDALTVQLSRQYHETGLVSAVFYLSIRFEKKKKSSLDIESFHNYIFRIHQQRFIQIQKESVKKRLKKRWIMTANNKLKEKDKTKKIEIYISIYKKQLIFEIQNEETRYAFQYLLGLCI